MFDIKQHDIVSQVKFLIVNLIYVKNQQDKIKNNLLIYPNKYNLQKLKTNIIHFYKQKIILY